MRRVEQKEGSSSLRASIRDTFLRRGHLSWVLKRSTLQPGSSRVWGQGPPDMEGTEGEGTWKRRETDLGEGKGYQWETPRHSPCLRRLTRARLPPTF